jgi:tRNA A-37 threonylcarbamoyl transferase component Bud32
MGKTSYSSGHAIDSFDIKPGRILARKYEVIELIGGGWEGEVYLVKEHPTDIERAVKLFYPKRNPRDTTANFNARKLHKLRHCPIAIQYHTRETITYRGMPITLLVSEFVEGELLSSFLKRQPGRRLTPFQGLHLLHALTLGIECIHQMKEYHGDLHTENIMIRRYGLGFDLKLLDFYHWGAPRPENIHEDVIDLVRILYEAVGGQKHYKHQPPEIKAICRGLKRSLILKQFRTAGQLRQYLETLTWQ